jgi:hypothetical protein
MSKFTTYLVRDFNNGKFYPFDVEDMAFTFNSIGEAIKKCDELESTGLNVEVMSVNYL